ncbi:hypothetical protein (mitochondrion) [Glycine soja]|uniref:Uncharacterized protein n=2 Tax=Glycine subgen. Soja TaxID=1462606 RepID=M1FQS1_SOYBN|nr:hypothetical protein I638_mgp007 [Glycine max]YP_009532880.1 hypothetical protein [Glycine soja]AFR34381.1 hypothetical protein GlmaxMp84 [Glycine max]AYD73028.1 hypothetical protein [Glycine soja]|eukprot:YP_007516933.1 hypothetical protein GlmaxMp84 (mitochondrion) [Glycine max]
MFLGLFSEINFLYLFLNKNSKGWKSFILLWTLFFFLLTPGPNDIPLNLVHFLVFPMQGSLVLYFLFIAESLKEHLFCLFSYLVCGTFFYFIVNYQMRPYGLVA